MPNIAVIILNWNGAKLLREFLPSVVANTDPALARVIVADNGSDDNSLEVLKSEFPEVEVMAFDKNYGFAEGYNRAIRLVDSEFVVLLNSDVAPSPGWIAPLSEYIISHPAVAACQPKILSYTDQAKFEYAGAAGGFLDRHGYPYCRGRIFATCEEDHGQYDTPMPIFWATGAALMVRRQVYLDAGGLDADFFAHMEEIDLCWRIRLMGWEIAAVPASVVYHLGGGSLPASNPRKTYLNFRNNLLMMHKNLPDATRGCKLFTRRLLDTVAWAKAVASLDFKNASAIWRAHRDFAKMRHQYTEHPQSDLLDTALPDILVSYYLLGKRRYSQISRK